MTDEQQKKIFSRNLNTQIAKSGKLQKDIAKELSISPTTFNTWCVGKIMPRMGKVQMLADYFGINKSELVDDQEVFETNKRTTAIRIPVFARVAAGLPIEATEEIIDWEEITPQMAAEGDYYALRVKGDSMEPRICNGDVVVARQQSDADSGDIVIALINGNDAVCKRLMKYENGTVALFSNNPAYEPMYFSKSEIDDTPVRIIGKVKELRAKF